MTKENMQFIIKIKEPAEKCLRKYDREIQKRFTTKIRKLQEHPDLHGKPLRGVLHGYWELYWGSISAAASWGHLVTHILIDTCLMA